MVNVRVRHDTQSLFLDFRYQGIRCREQTALRDTPANRSRVEQLAARIAHEMAKGCFVYSAHFPAGSKRAAFEALPRLASPATSDTTPVQESISTSTAPAPAVAPLFSEFAEQWVAEMSPQWRRSHRQGVREILDKNLLPFFGTCALSEIAKADVLRFRAELATQPGRRGAALGAGRINKVMGILRQVLNEAADRFALTPAFRAIRPLKQRRSDVQPFTLDEVNRILSTVRADYRDYLTVRFFTGLRSGEINGLKWKHVDLQRNLILVRESLVAGHEENDLKTESSQRDIEMLPMVRDAIDSRLRSRRPNCAWVFHTREGNPIDGHNFCNRVWYPLLRYLDLESRRPYQTRHTAATLMLASGENPEWIARTMGHSTTAMLFKVYSRFVPNLTRQDGRAFAGLIQSNVPSAPRREGDALLETLRDLPVDKLRLLVARVEAESVPFAASECNPEPVPTKTGLMGRHEQ
jgi:integrase